MVINFNVLTDCHTDPQDAESLCIVLVLSDCVGGELGLVETGIVANLRHGDLYIFPSADITHFNMDYQGKRVSMVFHSDKFAEGWVRDMNGWENNASFAA